MNIKGRDALLGCIDHIIQVLKEEGVTDLGAANRVIRTDEGDVTVGYKLVRMIEETPGFTYTVQDIDGIKYCVYKMQLTPETSYEIEYYKKVYAAGENLFLPQLVQMGTITLGDKEFGRLRQGVLGSLVDWRTDLDKLQEVKEAIMRLTELTARESVV